MQSYALGKTKNLCDSLCCDTGYIAVAWNPTNSVPKGYLYWEAGGKGSLTCSRLRGARAGVGFLESQIPRQALGI